MRRNKEKRTVEINGKTYRLGISRQADRHIKKLLNSASAPVKTQTTSTDLEPLTVYNESDIPISSSSGSIPEEIRALLDAIPVGGCIRTKELNQRIYKSLNGTLTDKEKKIQANRLAWSLLYSLSKGSNKKFEQVKEVIREGKTYPVHGFFKRIA